MVTINPSKNIQGTINAPASKSYAQRAIAIAALANGVSTLKNITLCNDISVALDVVKKFGAKVESNGNSFTIEGKISVDKPTILDIGEAGLSARLFTPIASLFEHEITITGHGSILKRPFDNIAEPLNALGADATTNNGLLPIHIKGPIKGGEIEIDGSLGSQFLTGLLIALPLVNNDTLIKVNNLTSIPYIDMTIRVMEEFGVKIFHSSHEQFFISGGCTYSPITYNVEGDWSGASCLLVAGALAGKEAVGIKVDNLNVNGGQADVGILKALEYAGAEIEMCSTSITTFKSKTHGFEFDATHCPDLFPAIVALAASSKGISRIKGTTRLTHKESDRATVLKDVYEKMGIEIDLSESDIMVIKGGKIKGGITIDSHNDHRIAMCIATSALVADSPITITNSDAVNKSYSNFWSDLESLTK